ncbi:MAG TPA: small metal-binding protein SmbP [Nitrospira sp.]|nr:small metal-binding protein SmbP [Nitrospira sp.]
MVTKRLTWSVTGYLSALVLFTACTSVESQVQKGTQQSKTPPGDRTVSYDPTDRLTPDNIGSRTERPVPSGRVAAGEGEAMARDRIVPCADDKGDASGSLDCDQMNRQGRRAGVRAEENDPSLAEACPSRLDATTGNVIYEDPTCPERYISLVGSCRSRVDAKGNIVYEDPNCPVRARRQMGSSFENIRWTQESSFYDRYTDKAVKHAREAELAGEQGHYPEMLRHAELSLDQAKEAQRVGHQPDLNEGIMALRNSISLGQSHLGPSATLAVRDARIKLSRAAGMNVRDTRTPEERATLAKAIAGLRTRTVKGQLARDLNDTRTGGGEHYVLKDQTREIPISLSPEMSRHVEVGDVVEAQINSKGQVVAISPTQ